MEIVEVKDPKAARAWVKLAGERSPVLAEVELHVFRGSTLRVLVGDDCKQPLSYNVTRFGKRQKNAWEPYANWYTAYTLKRYRRQGYAKQLATEVQRLAREAGCRRLKALAGTWLGVLLHASLGDQFWGLTEALEIVVDTPLVALPLYLGKTPPNSATQETAPWTLERITQELAGRSLRYETKHPDPS